MIIAGILAGGRTPRYAPRSTQGRLVRPFTAPEDEDRHTAMRGVTPITMEFELDDKEEVAAAPSGPDLEGRGRHCKGSGEASPETVRPDWVGGVAAGGLGGFRAAICMMARTEGRMAVCSSNRVRRRELLRQLVKRWKREFVISAFAPFCYFFRSLFALSFFPQLVFRSACVCV